MATAPGMSSNAARERRLASRRHGIASGFLLPAILALATAVPGLVAQACELRAGVAKIEISSEEAGPPQGPLYVKALVLCDGTTTGAILTLDVVAIGEIGPIGNEFLGQVRKQLESELGIPPSKVLVNASHCHGVVCKDVADRTVRAVREALRNLAPVNVGAGAGHEDRVMENRRLKLANGREADVRHAYALPPDEAVAGIGSVDPEIGILRLDRKDGRPLAVVYNFACHPIIGVPSGANTSDLTGFASQVIEDGLGSGAVALFLQGCAGDVNPIGYKAVDEPRDAQRLGNLLGLSALEAMRQVKCKEGAALALTHQTLPLPRADLAESIARAESEQLKLLGRLKGTSLNLKTFIPLLVKYRLAEEFPLAPSHRYLHDQQLGREDLNRLDGENRKNLEQYIANVHTMEELTRNQINLDLLKKHQARNTAAGSKTIDAEVVGLRVGEFRLIAFPGELSVEIGLNIKKRSPHALTFVSGCSNGYLYYAPTSEQLKNRGGAQEDSDCLLAPEWQAMFEDKAAELLKGL